MFSNKVLSREEKMKIISLLKLENNAKI